MNIKQCIAWGVLTASLSALGACKKNADMLLPDAAPSGAVGTVAAAEPSSPAPADSSGDVAPLAPLAPLAHTLPPPVAAAKPGVAPRPATSASAPPATTALPPACAAAKVMLANGRQKEFETLKSACLASGGHL